MIKMLVLDIDGTILSERKGISDNLKKHIRILRHNGIKVVIATGRMHVSARHIAKELGTDEPIISYQGGLVIDSDNRKLWSKLLDETLAKEVISYLRNEKIHINVYVNDELIVENISREVLDYVDGKYISYTKVDSLDNICFEGLNKVLAIDYDKEKIINLVDILREKYQEKLYIVRSTPHFCEVSHPEATKGNGIRFLAEQWKIEQHEIMAIGDQDNDIEMLKAAGKRVAMGNATENLKEVANFITKTVDEDGVVHAIKTFINLEELKCNIE